MTIYKTIFKILKTNLSTLLIGVAVTALITIMQSGNIREEQTEVRQVRIVILDKDGSELSQGLADYLKTEQTVVTLKDTSTKGLDDALYFNQASYILTIPEAFSEELNAGMNPTLHAQTSPSSFSKVLVDTTINQFLNTFLMYQRNQPEASYQDLIEQTNLTLQEKKTIQFDQSYTKQANQSIAAMFVNLLAYGLFSSIFSAYGLVNLAFNRSSIRIRNQCAPLSRRKLSRKIATANFGYSFFVMLGFSVFVLAFSKLDSWYTIWLFSLNIFVFFLVMVAFSSMVTSIVNSSETISGINNLFILGSCFISGVFVPLEFLPSIVTRIAAFTPTYWFVKTNELIGKTTIYSDDFYKTLGLNLGILIAFILAFLVIQFITLQERRSQTLPMQKRTAR